jgi:hypothetical protein
LPLGVEVAHSVAIRLQIVERPSGRVDG